jgi:hypothetical protein
MELFLNVSVEAPFWKTWEGCFFPRAFERRVRISYQNDYWGR